jgi:hypothetical protein
VGKPPAKEQVIHFINKKLPGGLPKKTARALLDIEDKDYVPMIRNPKATSTSESEAVFYFPGCGSERLFSPGRAGDAGHAVACGRADGAATRIPLLRLPATRLRRLRQGRKDHHRQPRVCSIAWPTR